MALLKTQDQKSAVCAGVSPHINLSLQASVPEGKPPQRCERENESAKFAYAQNRNGSSWESTWAVSMKIPRRCAERSEPLTVVLYAARYDMDDSLFVL